MGPFIELIRTLIETLTLPKSPNKQVKSDAYSRFLKVSLRKLGAYGRFRKASLAVIPRFGSDCRFLRRLAGLVHAMSNVT